MTFRTRIFKIFFANCDIFGERLFFFIEIVIPKSVVSIGKEAFKQCVELRSIEIPEGITIIQFKTFEHCKNLETIKLPSNLTEIENGAFLIAMN